MTPPRQTVPLVLESPVRVDNAMGGFRVDWRPLGVIHAGLRASTGAERQAEVGAASVVGWQIVVRAAPEGDPRRPRPDQRLRMGQRVFRIEAVAEADLRGLWLTCFAREERLA